MHAQSDPQPQLVHDRELRRYELDLADGEAYVTYRDVGETRVLDYSYVSPELRGTGMAGQLVSSVLDSVIADGQAARITCGYMRSVAARRQEWREHFLT